MKTKERYRLFRSYGHTRFHAATLSAPPELFYGSVIAVGALVGWFIQ